MISNKHLVTIKEFAIAETADLDIYWLRRAGQEAFNLYRAKYGVGAKPTTVTRAGNKSKGYDLVADQEILEGALLNTMTLRDSEPRH